MLAAIKNVQVVVHLTLLSVVVPASAQIFFGAIAEMVAFDPVELDTLIDFGLQLRPEDDFELDAGDNCQEQDQDTSDSLDQA